MQAVQAVLQPGCTSSASSKQDALSVYLHISTTCQSQQPSQARLHEVSQVWWPHGLNRCRRIPGHTFLTAEDTNLHATDMEPSRTDKLPSAFGAALRCCSVIHRTSVCGSVLATSLYCVFPSPIATPFPVLCLTSLTQARHAQRNVQSCASVRLLCAKSKCLQSRSCVEKERSTC